MSSFTDELNAEIDRRIEIMEDPAYEPVPGFTAGDFIAPAVVFALSLILIFISYAKV